MADIVMKGVSRDYGRGIYGVRDVDLEIRDGEFMCFLGPSGCGKSTTLRMIAGLEDITSGSLSIGGRDMTHTRPRDRNIAVVFQTYALYPHMSVRDNIAFGMKMRGVGRDERDARTAAAAEKLGLTKYLERKPAALSGGQRQRVALGRAIVREPDVFLMDEPLSNLDATLRAEMRLELVRLHRELGKTTVFVTHDQVEAMTMGERICILRDGEIMQVGRPLEVYDNPVNIFVARFLSSPPMNILPATLADGQISTEIAHFDLAPGQKHAYAEAQTRPLMLGIRAEDFYAEPAPGRVPVRGRLQVIEALGAENILILDLAGQQIAARVDRRFLPEVGDEIVLHLDVDSIHLFDAETEMAFARPDPESLRA
ncbi:MAG: ABC transporter ATP-binding protein [Rhodobacteraceae bacterium]|jgi:multiple sugar transport system ATP-binding protein|uniref:Carbohydrate ABC transporter ATP-binding protein, CUT1 family n=1 Tax=Salipiger profundus TaxID=1229727 RepID=A0A1U7DCQ8_9RHOB|nr:MULTISPECIES: ABC transporter ATP-binding protein [Salipiger]APX25941.1 carbohydrate ABC transporter ATP-binding protein, CUT1 family [Salipiger profundus]MAB05038.1 ABC transporter ATP-binding protein [Paracoccaceae bacterium]SFC83550.1 carbohydrate ABC transporter ATP-binding protein, CUT1 family [Salipiger profundus]